MKKKVSFLFLGVILISATSSYGQTRSDVAESNDQQDEIIVDKSILDSCVLSYIDVFKCYYEITSRKLEEQNMQLNIGFDDFCLNYYKSGLALNEYVSSFLLANEQFNIVNVSHKQPLLLNNNNPDADYILKGNLSNENDPYTTPKSCILRTINYLLASAYQKINDGDILVETKTIFSNSGHTAFIYDTNKHAEGKLVGRSTYIQTIEAVRGGVQYGFLDDNRIVDYGVVIIRPNNLSSSIITKAKTFIHKQVGKKYLFAADRGYYNTSESNQYWYCSELVYAAYYNAGLVIASPSSSGYMMPMNILYSSKVNYVSYYNTLELQFLGKLSSTKFKFRVFNKTGYSVTLYYNSKLCFENHAKNWTNQLKHWNNTATSLANNSYVDIVISSNFLADVATICYVKNGKRYITYGDEVNTDVRVAVHKNVINA